jgi:probable biosynthetic protein (TIGR04098 family)
LELRFDSDECSVVYEPSPYIDYNGLGLLYFAAYPAIVESQARNIFKRAAFDTGGKDWAHFASPVARDIHYYRNLDMGTPMRVTINGARRDNALLLLHTRALNPGGVPLADVLTVKRCS